MVLGVLIGVRNVTVMVLESNGYGVCVCVLHLRLSHNRHDWRLILL
jgi:hypothetical protein